MHNGARLGLDVHAPLSHLDSMSLMMQAAQRGDAAAVSRLMRQQIQQDAGRPVPLFEPDEVRSYVSLQQRAPHDTPPSSIAAEREHSIDGGCQRRPC